MEEYFDNLFNNVDDNIYLDSEQREVILDNSDKLIVIAGAGSGKTTTMTAKVKYLVEIRKIDPKAIVLISFTNKAVDELKMRINKQFNIPSHISTFHSLAFSILKQNGYKFKIESNPQKIVENFLRNNKKDVKNLKNPQYCLEILNLYKNNAHFFHHKNKFWKSFLKFYEYYNNYMVENNLIDFEDMINKCNELLNKKDIRIKYNYIIIDEFQDISLNRYKLIEQISKKSNCKIIAVGDDWQAIFSFAGSDINLFQMFSKDAKMLKITHTYRNSQELIDIAGSFVMKNSHQIIKQLKSNKKLENVIKVFGYIKETKCLCKTIDNLVLEYGLDQKILLIGRYNFDINKYIDNISIIKKGNGIIYNKHPNLNITFLTAHASKGLGFDNVIIINGNKGIFGFPSLKEDDKIKRSLLNKKENFLYAEERRLFYVALTRTKNKVYILYKLGYKSVFIKELIKYKEIKTKFII